MTQGCRNKELCADGRICFPTRLQWAYECSGRLGPRCAKRRAALAGLAVCHQQHVKIVLQLVSYGLVEVQVGRLACGGGWDPLQPVLCDAPNCQ